MCAHVIQAMQAIQAKRAASNPQPTNSVMGVWQRIAAGKAQRPSQPAWRKSGLGGI